MITSTKQLKDYEVGETIREHNYFSKPNLYKKISNTKVEVIDAYPHAKGKIIKTTSRKRFLIEAK